MTSTSPAGTGVGGPPSTRPAGYLDPDAFGALLRDRLDGVVDVAVAYGQLTVTVEPGTWVAAARLCKSDPALDCSFWEFLDAIDRGDDGFDMSVHLYSPRHRHDVTFRTRVPGGRSAPVMPSLTGVYRGANWSERETYDMFGIDFEGHPGLLPRILTIESFEGWPLRKDFLLATREAKPWPGAKEPEERTEAGESADAGSATPEAVPVTGEDKAAAAKAKAERAKAKAAAMRAQRAEERAAAQRQAGEAPADTTAADVAASDAQRATPAEAAAAGDASPGGDLIAESAERFGGGDTTGEAAAAAATAAGDPTAATPEGAAEVADTAVAKDAAAGAAQGDLAERAPQDAPGVGEPVLNPEGEAKAAQGAPPVASGAPGPEAEGRHGGAELQSGDRPAAQTPGMTSATQAAEAATTVPEPGRNPPPAPGPDSDVPASPGAQAETDVPVVPAPGSQAAPLAGDEPADDADKGGVDSAAAAVDPPAGPGPQSEPVSGNEPAPPASSGTDAADRRGPDYRREPGTDDAREPEDER